MCKKMIYNLPEQYQNRLAALGESVQQAVVERAVSEPSLGLLLVSSAARSAGERFMAALDVDAEPIVWCEHAWLAPASARAVLTQSECYQRGDFYLQDLASLLPPLLLDPKPGEEVLDMTAAPGGKTIHLALRMQQQGRLAAVERSKHRYHQLRANLKRFGMQHVHCYQKNALSLGRSCADRFDKVLLDAPCSLEAQFDPSNPDSYGAWSLKKVKRLAHEQLALLNTAMQIVKPGGYVVYSTCTLSPEENEGVISNLLAHWQDRVAIEAIDLPITNRMAGITEWQDVSYNAEVMKTERVLPSQAMHGFYIAKLRRIS